MISDHTTKNPHGNSHPLASETVAAILAAYRRGDAVRVIAAAYQTSAARVCRLAFNAGVPSREKKYATGKRKTDARGEFDEDVSDPLFRGLGALVDRGAKYFWSKPHRLADAPADVFNQWGKK